MRQNAPCFSIHIWWIRIIPMYRDFLRPRELQGTHMDTLKPKNSKSKKCSVWEDFFTFWAILAHSGAWCTPESSRSVNPTSTRGEGIMPPQYYVPPDFHMFLRACRPCIAHAKKRCIFCISFYCYLVSP